MLDAPTLLSLESSEDWTNIVTGSITAAVLLVALLAGLWKFMLQQPLGNHWQIYVLPCNVRRIGNRLGYIMSVTVENQSAATHHIHGWWRQVVFPDDADATYDPNSPLEVFTEEVADNHYKFKNRLNSPYALAAGEKYSDEMIWYREGALKEVCFLEYTLLYRKWRWLPPGWVSECLSQKMIAPVEREDL